MTTVAHSSSVDLFATDYAATPTPDSDLDYDESLYPEEPADIAHVFYFLTFTLKESIQQTVHAFLQSFKCTLLLVSELHRPYLDSVRLLVPLWLAVVHAILLVLFVLAHRTITDAIQRLHDIQHRSSRLPTPRLPFRKRPVISAPFGPVQHNARMIIPSRPTTTSESSSVNVDGEMISKSGRLSLGSHKSELHLSRDPCCIYTEQPSAYWTGRFNSLHDKFLGECLTSNNLQSLVGAQADRAVARNQHRQPHLLRETQYTRFNPRLPPSATSAAILQQTAGGGLGGDTGSKQSPATHAADAELLLDDDERCKRVFVHLEAFCATDDARSSLFAWQRDFARKTGRPKLLPKGGTMGDGVLGSYISRLGVRRIGKRASMY
ncbi:hypothetical protein diail_9428 [Diaporthe ilicicola]|nr:hypothetical protein diail_9428 [Diaporthe ilicicola]